MKLQLIIFLLGLAVSSPGKPNIILFYADDLGWTDTGSQGSPYYETPHIDSLAKTGISFSNAYAGAANCAPSRACLITGLYTPRHGVYTVGNSDRGKTKLRKLIPIANKTVLDPEIKTLPQALKDAGYKTCVAGKWHLSCDPLTYGFDANFGGCEWGHPKSYFSPYKSPTLSDGPKGEHLPARLAKDVSGWIKENKDEPFFVYFPFYSVHTPIQAREDLIDHYQAKKPGIHHNNPKYAAMISAMDEAIGNVLKTLDENNLTNNTIVIFTSDNGPHGAVSNALPLRGNKGMFYEGGIREPFIIRWPGKSEPGSTSDSLVHQIDLFPTLTNATGAKPPELLDGKDITNLIEGGSAKPRDLYWHFPAYLQSDGNAKSRGSRSDHFRTTPCSVIRRGDWKLIEYFEDGAIELYNLREDPYENNDLSSKNIEIKDELLKELQKWRKETNAPMPVELNPNYTG